MFGYLRVKNCRLDEFDRTLYKSHFCSACHNLRSFGGWDASMLTNYDITLWGIVATGVRAQDYQMLPEQRPCTALPLKNVSVQPVSPEVGACQAAFTILLTWAKLEDNRQDGGAPFLARLGQLWLGKREAKARDYLASTGFPVQAILDIPAAQQQAETSSELSLDDLQGPTRHAVSEIFAWIGTLADRMDLLEPLRNLGAALADYIYIWDALDDLEKDRKRGDFNAISALWPTHFPKNHLRHLLLESLRQVEEALEDLPLGNRRKLCQELVASLTQKVREHPELVVASPPVSGPRRTLAQAGFCDLCDCFEGGCDGCNCCDVGCCDGGLDGCNCCEVSCCDCSPGDSCCEISCCDCCCCGDFCCCISDSSKPVLPETPGAAPSTRSFLCPGCRRDMKPLPGLEASSCGGCGGVWVCGGELGLFRAQHDLRAGLLRSHAVQRPAIPQGQRTCPDCQNLLRSGQPESCDSCNGAFFTLEGLREFDTRARE